MTGRAPGYRKNRTCRYCGSGSLERYLSLGEQPPSNSFIRADQIATEARYPLDVYRCGGCALSQLLDVVPAEAIFDDYVYLSSTSKALVQHYGRLAETVTARFGLGKGDVVVDIGCNDGVLLKGYTLPGLVRVGVEPSKVAEVALAAGFTVLREFFSTALAKQIVEQYGCAKVVTATNVFAHVDAIGDFVEGLLPLLGDDGAFVIEAPYLLDMFEQTLFDTIYHEHLCYLSLTPLMPFLERHALEVFDVERVPFGASGPAIRVFVQPFAADRPVRAAVQQMLEDEARWGVERPELYQGFARAVERIRAEVLEILARLKSDGAHIGGYGAPAKGNTLLNYLGLAPSLVEYIAETNAWKQGLLTPGSHIPIVSEEEFLTRMPEYALLLSWNYLDFFLGQSDYIRRGGRFIVPMPSPRIAPPLAAG